MNKCKNFLLLICVALFMLTFAGCSDKKEKSDIEHPQNTDQQSEHPTEHSNVVPSEAEKPAQSEQPTAEHPE